MKIRVSLYWSWKNEWKYYTTLSHSIKKNYNSQVDHFLFLLAVSSWYHFFDLFLIVVVEEKPGETRLPKEKPGKPSKTAKSKNIKD